MNEVQKYLDFLYRCSIADESIDAFEEGKHLAVCYEVSNNKEYFNYKKIYDTLSNFAFLSLLNNSSIRIDNNMLNDMVNDGKFIRVVDPSTIEGDYIKGYLEGAIKQKNSKIIKNRFDKDYSVDVINNRYVVQTTCHPIVSYDWLNYRKVNSKDIINIIRNGMIHSKYFDKESQVDEFYKTFLENTKDEKSYSFRSNNDCVVVLATESWLREFKKVFFLDSHCFLTEDNNDFYFMRFLPVNDKVIRSEEDLMRFIESSISTKIKIKDNYKNFMEARSIIEDHLFKRVLAKDIQLKHILKTKKGDELLEHLNNHNEDIKQLISKVLIEKGYNNFEISFVPTKSAKNIENIKNLWRAKVKDIKDFYKFVELKDQLCDLSRCSNLFPYNKILSNEEIKYGINPQMISLLLSTVESTDLRINAIDKYNALMDLENEKKISDFQRKRINSSIMLNNKSGKNGFRITDENIHLVYKFIEGSVDKEKYNKVSIINYFASYFSRHELAFVVGCASIYNALIENEFYENVCVREDKNKKQLPIDNDIYNALKDIDMSNFSVVKNGRKVAISFSVSDKLWLLSNLRNSLVHGGGRIDYSTISDDVSKTNIIFQITGVDYQIYTNVDSIMKVFNDKLFYKELNKENIKERK